MRHRGPLYLHLLNSLDYVGMRKTRTTRKKGGANNQEETELHKAVRENNLAKVDELLTEGANVNAISIYGVPLWIACQYGYADIVSRLLQTPDININFSSDEIIRTYNTTPLWIASQNGKLSIVEQLLAMPGIDVNKSSLNNTSPLMAACKNNRIEIVKRLLASPHIKVNQGDFYNFTALHFACQYASLEIVNLLLEVPRINVNAVSTRNVTPLYMASDYNRPENAKRLISVPGINVNKTTFDDESPLYRACERGHIHVIEELLKSPDIDVNKIYGFRKLSTLEHACTFGKINIVRLLLAFPGIDTKNVINAAEKGEYNYEIRKLLLESSRPTPRANEVYWIQQKEGEEDTDGLMETIEEGNTLAILNPKFPDQRVVIQKANGSYTDGWRYLQEKQQNPFTRESINPNRMQRVTAKRPTGGRRIRKRTYITRK